MEVVVTEIEKVEVVPNTGCHIDSDKIVMGVIGVIVIGGFAGLAYGIYTATAEND